MDGYVFRNNKFIENKNDVVACAGDNITFEGNEFSSMVYMYGRATNYKFLNNKFENVRQGIRYEYNTDTICSGNTYINSTFGISRKGNEGNITINNETLINSNVNDMNNEAQVVNSKIISDENIPIRLAGNYKDCIIKIPKGNFISTKMYNCQIEDTISFLQKNSYFETCSIKNSTLESTSNTETIHFTKSNFLDSKIGISSWGSAVNLIVENNNINIKNKMTSFLDFSAGKAKKVLLKNNYIENNIKKSIINMNDTVYTTPNANIILESNELNQINYPYIFDGVDIKQGIVKFTEFENQLKGKEIFNPKYENNKYFRVNN